jgi:hypothetical protein
MNQDRPGRPMRVPWRRKIPDRTVSRRFRSRSSRRGRMTGMVRTQDELSELFDGRTVHVSMPAILGNPYRRNSTPRDSVQLCEAAK